MNLPHIEQLQDGDSEAWDVVFNWLWPKSLNISSQLLAPIAPADAEDVAIEAFTILFQNIHEIQSTERLPSMMVVITKNCARSHLRKLSAAKRGFSKTITINNVLEGEMPVDDGNPLESLKTRELFDLLEHIRMELPNRSARFIQEYYLKGLSHRDIAARYGLPVSSVSGTIRRGLWILRVALEKKFIFSADLPSRMRIN
jgi:RNA polymerase sigma factor (sigma-70 family)